MVTCADSVMPVPLRRLSLVARLGDAMADIGHIILANAELRTFCVPTDSLVDRRGLWA